MHSDGGTKFHGRVASHVHLLQNSAYGICSTHEKCYCIDATPAPNNTATSMLRHRVICTLDAGLADVDSDGSTKAEVHLALSQNSAFGICSTHEKCCDHATQSHMQTCPKEQCNIDTATQRNRHSGRMTNSIKPMCFRTEAPRPSCTTRASVAELTPLVVVVPALLASPPVALALRPVAVVSALEVVVTADSAEPVACSP